MGRAVNEALAVIWRQRIAKQRRSQLSVAAFCGQEGVSPKSFYAWRRRLREKEGAAAPAALFVPVELLLSSGVRIELPGGAVLMLPAESPLELMTTAIRAVLKAASPEERPSC